MFNDSQAAFYAAEHAPTLTIECAECHHTFSEYDPKIGDITVEIDGREFPICEDCHLAMV